MVRRVWTFTCDTRARGEAEHKHSSRNETPSSAQDESSSSSGGAERQSVRVTFPRAHHLARQHYYASIQSRISTAAAAASIVISSGADYTCNELSYPVERTLLDAHC